MILNGFTCSKCKQTVYPRCKFDLHTCFCCNVDCHGNIVNKEIPAKSVEIEVDATARELELDFYYNGGQFGTIKG